MYFLFIFKMQCLIKLILQAAATLETVIELLQMRSFFLDISRPAWPDRYCISSAFVIILGNSNVDSDVSNPVLNSRRISQNSPPPVPFLWSHNSSGKVTRTLHSHPHCQQSQNLCKISTFWIWGATSIPRWCIAAREAESSHISTVFCPIRNAVSEGGQLSKKSICHKAKNALSGFS